MCKLTQRERQIVTTIGIPAKQVASFMRLTVHEVLELRHELRARGVLARSPGVDYSDVRAPREEQLDFNQLMRTNVPLV